MLRKWSNARHRAVIFTMVTLWIVAAFSKHPAIVGAAAASLILIPLVGTAIVLWNRYA